MRTLRGERLTFLGMYLGCRLVPLGAALAVAILFKPAGWTDFSRGAVAIAVFLVTNRASMRLLLRYAAYRDLRVGRLQEK